MREEFRRYGLPDWMRTVVGGVKLTLAALLVAGVAYVPLAVPAAAAMALLMVGAVGAHLRVRDPLVKAAPAMVMLLMATVVLVVRAS